LPIPVFRKSLFEDQKQKKTGFLRIFFLCFPEDFSQGRGFGEVPGIPVFGRHHRNFSQESCGTGIPVFSPDSSGFLRIPAGFLFPPNLWYN
jgi:hypothetical protein